jgi:hypothetical protein
MCLLHLIACYGDSRVVYIWRQYLVYHTVVVCGSQIDLFMLSYHLLAIAQC